MKTLQLTLVVLISFFAIATGQNLPIVGTVLPGQTNTVINTGLQDNTPLTIQNTSAVPLRFCLSNSTTSCAGIPTSVRVERGETKQITVLQLGGITAGANLNVTNEGIAIGAFSVAIGPGTGGPNTVDCALIADPNAWGASSITSSNLFVCPTRYTSITVPYAFVQNGITINTAVNVGGQFSIVSGSTPLWSMGTDNNRNFSITSTQSNVTPVFISKDGNIGLGTTQPDPAYKLSINGDVKSKRVKVQLNGWADYVFNDDYKLMSLTELEQFINENNHLPEIPAASEIEKDGADLGELVKKQMAKIEELTLHVIAQQKRIEALEAEINKK